MRSCRAPRQMSSLCHFIVAAHKSAKVQAYTSSPVALFAAPTALLTSQPAAPFTIHSPPSWGNALNRSCLKPRCRREPADRGCGSSQCGPAKTHFFFRILRTHNAFIPLKSNHPSIALIRQLANSPTPRQRGKLAAFEQTARIRPDFRSPDFPTSSLRARILLSAMFSRSAVRISSTPVLKRFRRGRPDRGRRLSR